MFVYAIVNSINEKPYVGLTTRSIHQRFKEHLKEAARGVESQLYRAIRKHGVENFQVIELDRAVSLAGLKMLESLYISALGSDDREHGYNGNAGGYHPSLSEETRRRISASRMGKKLSDEHRQKLSAIRKGVPHSAEVRERERVMLTARNKSPEMRAKVSAAKTGVKKGPMSDAQKVKLSESNKRARLKDDPSSYGYVALCTKIAKGKEYSYWRAILKKDQKKYVKQFKTQEDAEEYRRLKSLELFSPLHNDLGELRRPVDLPANKA